MTDELRRVAREWERRVGAEYRSAALAQHLGLWLIQVGAPPDLVAETAVVTADELVHAALSAEVVAAVGGKERPAVEEASLSLVREPDKLLIEDLLRAVVGVFCVGETVAVPLFTHLCRLSIHPPARRALSRIVADETRHRRLGWDLLDWLGDVMPPGRLASVVSEALPGLFSQAFEAYAERPGATPLTEVEMGWGLAPSSDYALIVASTLDKEWIPRFALRGIDAGAAWDVATGRPALT